MAEGSKGSTEGQVERLKVGLRASKMKSKSHGCKSSLLPGPRCLVEMEMTLEGEDMDIMVPLGLTKPVGNPSLWVRLHPGPCCPSPCGTRRLSTKHPEHSTSQAVSGSFPHSMSSAEATPTGEWILVSKHACEMKTEQLFLCQELRMPPGKKPQLRPSWGLWSSL